MKTEPASILIVEDEPIIAMDLAAQLEDMGYRICGIAASGQEAISLARQHKPRLVLMDIVIQGEMDGIETARHVGRGMHIPVVFLTSYSDARTVERAAQTAPYGYLTKPFQTKELRAVIEVALYKATLEQRLRESEQWFAATLRCVGDGVIAIDSDSRVRFMNPPAESVTGWSFDDALGREVNEILHLKNKNTGAPVASPLHRALRDDTVTRIDYGTLLTARDGSMRPVDDSAAPIRGEDGRVLGAVLVLRDVSERVRAEESLRQSEERFRNAFDFAPAGMALVALDGRFLQVNNAICYLLGHGEQELVGMSEWRFTHPDDAATERACLSELLSGRAPAVQFEKRYRHRGNPETWVLASVSLLRERDEPVCYLYQIYDLTEQKTVQDRLERLAHYDTLTGLSNRARLRIEAENVLHGARRHQQRFAVVFIDIDQFKRINDSLGHEAGDQLLQAVALRLKACVRETDCVARLGGDEFVLLLVDLNRAEDASLVTEKVRMALSEPFSLVGNEVPVTVSLGVSLYPDDGDELPTLFRCADSALYHAKAEGRNNTQFYRPEQTARAEARLKVESSLHRALERGEFVLHYQPILSLASGRPVGAEALIRWHHPERGMVAPDTFIPVAAESGLIVELGEWVLHEACLEAAKWKKTGNALTVSVNVAARQFKAGTLVEAVERALKGAALDPALLCLEITEQHVLQDTEYNLAVIEKLKALGVCIAVDDFGVGYSSLSYLKRYAPKRLKIDRSFVRDVVDDADDAAIVSAVIAMAKRLKIGVIAEGVETEAQRAFLAAEGCDEAQGYLFARPCAAEDFRVWLERQSGSTSPA